MHQCTNEALCKRGSIMMAGGEMGLFFALIMFLSQGAGDLLDMISTEAYWQNKNVVVTVEQLQADADPGAQKLDARKLIEDLGSTDYKVREAAARKIESMGPDVLPQVQAATENKDAEIAAAAKDLVTRLTVGSKGRDVRQLMAIRTLGERKEKAALPLLKKLTESKKQFVSDYAVRAIARIEGKPVQRLIDEKGLASDLWLLPKDTGIVGQLALRQNEGTPMPSVDKLIAKAMDDAAAAGNAQPGILPMPDKAKLVSRVSSEMIKLMEKVGNVRIDGVTMGVAEDMGRASGWVALTVRGEYDPAAIVEAIKSIGHNDIQVEKKNGVEVVTLEPGEAYVIVPSSKQFMFVGGPRQTNKEPLIDAMVAAVKAGKGALHENKATSDLIAKADTKAMFWVTGTLTEGMREDVFKPFETFSGAVQRNKDVMTYKMSATGSDEEVIKKSVEDMKTEMQNNINQMNQMIQQMPQMAASMKPVLDLMTGLKLEANGKTATASGELKGDALQSMLTSAVPFLGLMLREAPDAPMPIEPGIGN